MNPFPHIKCSGRLDIPHAPCRRQLHITYVERVISVIVNVNFRVTYIRMEP